MKTIEIRTEVPGPNSRTLMARRGAVPMGLRSATPLFAARAEGAVIEDVDGNRFLDFAGGIGALNVGHLQAPIIDAIKGQLEKHLIADEVQSGIGRTGRWFASEHFGLEPDLIASAKSLGGGMPIAAITGRKEVMDAPILGSLGSTFAGNPVSCAAALAAIEIIEKRDLLTRAIALGEKFEKRARSWQQKWGLVGDVRGLGGMRAVELVRDRKTLEPAATETQEVAEFCWRHGLVLLTAGTYNNVLRVLVPLVVEDDQFDEGLDVIEGAISFVVGARA